MLGEIPAFKLAAQPFVKLVPEGGCACLLARKLLEELIVVTGDSRASKERIQVPERPTF